MFISTRTERGLSGDDAVVDDQLEQSRVYCVSRRTNLEGQWQRKTSEITTCMVAYSGTFKTQARDVEINEHGCVFGRHLKHRREMFK